ncbi:MAG: hypothetical protein ACLFS7_07115, partial [Desulfosudaceae bacterium]
MGWQSKKFEIKAQSFSRNAAYLAVREIPRKTLQRRYRTFYEAITIVQNKNSAVSVKVIFIRTWPLLGAGYNRPLNFS